MAEHWGLVDEDMAKREAGVGVEEGEVFGENYFGPSQRTVCHTVVLVVGTMPDFFCRSR